MKPYLIKNIAFFLPLMAFASITVAQSDEWSGLYGGFNVGRIFNNVTVDANHLGLVSPDGTCQASTDYSSFTSGVQLGYSRSLDSKIVLGIDGDFTYNSKNSDNADCPCPTAAFVIDQFTFTNRLQGSARARLGYALDDYFVLPFITGGVSVTDLGLNYTNENSDYYSKNKVHVGWLVGGGLEWAWAPQWSLRGEYLYQDYGKTANLALPVIYGLSDSNGNADAHFSANNIRLSINYWIN